MESYDNTLVGYSGAPPSIILSVLDLFHRAAGCPTRRPIDMVLSATIEGQTKKIDTKGPALREPHTKVHVVQGIPIFKGQGNIVSTYFV